MPVIPAAPPVRVVVDGRPISAYTQPYVRGGHVFAPIRPFLNSIVDRAWYEGNRLALARKGTIVYISLSQRAPDALDHAAVALAPLARALGARVNYRRGLFEIVSDARIAVASPTPVPPTAMVPPNVVFTPTPLQTPRPIWHGPALPRRTPLPYAAPTPVSQ